MNNILSTRNIAMMLQWREKLSPLHDQISVMQLWLTTMFSQDAAVGLLGTGKRFVFILTT